MPKWARVVVAAAVVVVAGLVVWRWVVDDQARPIPTAEVVDRFRAAATSAPTTEPATDVPATTERATDVPATSGELAPRISTVSPPESVDVVGTTTLLPVEFGVPETGVYRYATSGGEEIDALGGTRHDYPAETTITVTPDGCGVRLRWDALRERYEEWGLCATAAGVELQTDAIQYHEFYSRSETEAVVCEPGVVLVPVDPSTSERTEQQCALADEPWLPVWEVLERTTRTVEGVDVDVTHVRMTVLDEDEYWERTTVDWYLTDHGLPVEVTNTNESLTSTLVGDVLYQEEYELTLISLSPIS